MNQDSYQTSQPQSATPVDEWFKQATTPTQPPAPKRSKRIVVAALILLTVVASATGIFALLNNPSIVQTQAACYPVANYKDLVTIINNYSDDGMVTLDNIRPQQLLYSHRLYFTPTLPSIDSDASPDASEFITALGNYYKQHASTAPIVVRVKANYSTGTNEGIVKTRIANIKAALQQAGFGTEYIVTEDPVFIQQDDETDFEDNDVVVISIAPSASCDATEPQ